MKGSFNLIKVGIVGVGTIGSQLARHCLSTFRNDVRLVGVVDRNSEREKTVLRELGLKRRLTLSRLVAESDLVIEAAEAASAWRIVREAMSHGKDVMVMSAGGLVGKAKEIEKLAREHRSCIYLPSGAIAGIDGLKSAGIGSVQSVSLTTRKNPIGFRGAPYVIKKKIDLDGLKGETLLFEGPADRAIAGFPQNINVSATLSLAGIGARRTHVRIFAVPGLKRNIHEISVEGEFGSFYTRTENLPSKVNPKTSELAIFSAVATLKRILNYVKIGT